MGAPAASIATRRRTSSEYFSGGRLSAPSSGCRLAKSSFDEGAKTLEAFTGAHVPKRQFEQEVIRAAQDFEAFYADRQTRARADPHTGPILVLTVDGKGVVMRPEDLREATQRAAAARAKTFTARLGGGRRLHAKRMASVAAIYTVEPWVRTPEEILAAAAPAGTQTRLGQPGPVAGGGDPGDVRGGGAPGSDATEALGRCGRWQSPAD